MKEITVDEHYASIPRICAICGSATNLVRDHDHDTGRCRGWLCNRCNMVFGHVEGLSIYALKWKELEIMKAMLAYAEYWGERNEETGRFRSQDTPLYPKHKANKPIVDIRDLIGRL
jgi:hypothetical protein